MPDHSTLFDTHLHLDTDELPGELFNLARQVGVERFLLAGTELANSLYVAAIAARESGAVAAAGVHPHAAASFASMDPFRELLTRREVVAVGEIGLDYHYNHSPQDVQKKVFRQFLQVAVETGLPPIIHCRDAFDDCLSILRDVFPQGRPFEIHSFTGTPHEAETVLELGGLLSFNGMLTFKKAHNIREALAAVPLDRLLLETDAPWLAPVPYRGKRNQPAYIVEIARAAAELKNVPFEQVAQVTTENACRLFSGHTI